MTDETPAEVPERKELSPEDLLTEVDQLRSTRERLLKESKDYANKYRSLRDDVDQKEKLALEKAENHKTLYERSESKIKEMELQLAETKKRVKEKEFLFQVAKYAPDARDITLVAQKLPRDVVAWNEDTLSFDGIEDGIKSVKKTYDYLFDSKKSISMVNSVPSLSRPEPKTLGQMNSIEKKGALQDALKTILNQKG